MRLEWSWEWDYSQLQCCTRTRCTSQRTAVLASGSRDRATPAVEGGVLWILCAGACWWSKWENTARNRAEIASCAGGGESSGSPLLRAACPRSQQSWRSFSHFLFTERKSYDNMAAQVELQSAGRIVAGIGHGENIILPRFNFSLRASLFAYTYMYSTPSTSPL